MMKALYYLFFGLCLFIGACQGIGQRKNHVEKEVNIKISRCDKLLSEYVRSNSFSAYSKLHMNHPQETKVLIERVLELGQVGDDTISEKLKSFYKDTTLLRLIDDVDDKFADLGGLEDTLTKAFGNLKEEIPYLSVPKFYAQISAFNESIIITDSLFGISLDKYMGSDYPLYQRFYYEYQRHYMRPDRIAPDCIISYLMSEFPFPYRADYCLIDFLIYSGKMEYIMSEVLDYESVGEAMGYTEQEDNWCVTNEHQIWKFMQTNKHLNAHDLALMKKYVRPLPFKEYFGDDTPSFIGMWVGARIVEAYMENHPKVTFDELLHLNDYAKILEESNYLN